MDFFQTVGFSFVAATSVLGTIAVIVAAYRNIKNTLDHAKRGAVETQRDVQRVADQQWLSRIEKESK